MRNSRTGWVPSGDFGTESQRYALGVETAANPGPELWRYLLTSRLQALIDASPRHARLVIEASCEHAPEMWMIAHEISVEHWGFSIANSEAVLRLTRQVDWFQPGEHVSISRLMPFDAFVESLP